MRGVSYGGSDLGADAKSEQRAKASRSNLPSPVTYKVTLPKTYDASRTKPYPVLLIIPADAGYGGVLGSLSGTDALCAMNDRKFHDTHDAIVCELGFNRPSWVADTSETNHESFLLDVLLPRLTAAYNCGRFSLIGYANGGFGALHLLMRHPEVFLFDEPLSNLDAALRTQMRVELAQLHQSIGATMIYVTHDQVEAMTLADQIVVMKDGHIEQVGAPMELYDRPASEFVAGFIGSPKMNLLPGRAIARDDVKIAGIRPEHLHIESEGQWRAVAKVVETLGADTIAYMDAEGLGEITVRLPGHIRLKAGERLALSPEAANLHLFGHDGRRMEHSA